jgi:hypothetical protein
MLRLLLTSQSISSTSTTMLFVTYLAIAAAAVSASPVERQAKTAVVPLTHVVNVKSIKNIVNNGLARIDNINGRAGLVTRQSGSVTNEAVTYIAPISIGGSTFDLIVDTGCTSPQGTP